MFVENYADGKQAARCRGVRDRAQRGGGLSLQTGVRTLSVSGEKEQGGDVRPSCCVAQIHRCMLDAVELSEYEYL